jgi:arylsulfatase A-like enzyme
MRSIRNHTQVFLWIGKPGYNLIIDMANDAIGYMRSLDGTHAPHHPTQELIDKFKGKFKMGWNALREQIFANQKRLVVVPANAELTPWPDDILKNWNALSALPFRHRITRSSA